MLSRILTCLQIHFFTNLSINVLFGGNTVKTLIKNVVCLDLSGDSTVKNVIVDGTKVSYVGETIPESETSFDNIINGDGCILSPGFVNAHCHTPMTLLRGLGSDCPLDVWLNEHIFPVEDRLNGDLAYIGTLSAIAEMLRGGVISYSDMYFFCDRIADAVIKTGIKANISRSVVSFDENEDPSKNFRVTETLSLFNDYHGAADGRVKVDFSLHAEYTNTERMCRYLAELAKEYGTGMQIHLSETKKEHEEGTARRGMTPTAFFEKCGVFDVPVSAAHCVWLDDNDIDIMVRHGATAVTNPRSNLKLGSGIMNFDKYRNAGMNIAIGTDGSASNNKLDVIADMQLAAILSKGIFNDATAVPAKEVIKSATFGGYMSQGRPGVCAITEGMTADLILISCDRPGVSISEDPISTIAYASDRSDIVMTMVDGRILFENGEYNTIDTEWLNFEFNAARKKLQL